jgi:hypothetical protein
MVKIKLREMGCGDKRRMEVVEDRSQRQALLLLQVYLRTPVPLDTPTTYTQWRNCGIFTVIIVIVLLSLEYLS